MSGSVARLDDPALGELRFAGQPRAVDVYGASQDDLHKRLVGWFEEAEQSSLDEREAAEKARQYTQGIQWTKEELDALRLRGQPAITINKIGEKVQLLCGLERKARTDPKAFPATPSEDDRADAATQALRFIAGDNDFPVTRSAVYEEMLVEGFGGAEISIEHDGRGGADVRIRQAPWDRLWHDPHSRARDFSDARYLGMVIWADRAQLLEMFPDAGDVIEDCFTRSLSQTFDDRPRDGVAVMWTDTRRRRARVVQCWWQERGRWWGGTFTKSGFLAEPYPSPLKDKHGRSACPLILQSAYVDRDNRRFGIVRDLISMQDEINKRRSKALHLLSVNRVIAEHGAVDDVDKARREAAKPDGFLQVQPGLRFEILPGGDLAAGQFQLLQHATGEMQLAGPNAAMAGTDPRELSGRAILAQQAGGAAQNEPLADALRMWARRIYECCWQAAREYWTAPRWVRVTDELGATRWVGINRQVTLRDELAAMAAQQRAMAMQQLQIQPGDPRLEMVVRTEGDISDLDVDVVVEEGIDIPSIAAEQFQTLVQLAGLQPGLIPGDVLIAASGLKNKAALLERMKAHQEAQAQQQAQMAPLVQAHQQADVAQKQAKAAADWALANERAHGVHAGWQEMQQPPDAPSEPGTAVPPDVQMAHHMADLRGKHAAAAVQEARVNDLLHATAGRIADAHRGHMALALQAQAQGAEQDMARRQMMQPQMQPQGPAGGG